MAALEDLPASPGSYALWFDLPVDVRRKIGRLGEFDFPRGSYLYFGSAHGPGGLCARVHHHRRVAAHPRWHLDWLRPELSLIGIWFTTAPGNWECAWSQAILELPGVTIPAPGFGAADCRSGCAAHLVELPGLTTPNAIAGVLEDAMNRLPGEVVWLSA